MMRKLSRGRAYAAALAPRAQAWQTTTMNLRDVWTSLAPAEKHALAAAAGTSYIYMSQMAGGQRNPSPRLCRKLVAAEPRLTLEGLRPDIYGTATAQ